ncbi:MAG: fibronectin type III domain-containing protein [Firmicutes bacterium]|nr:fibronectin type III domain-containing protein [Bacillota bacterium]
MAQKLSNLANKSKVKFGSLYGSPIVWIVADKNHAGYPSNSVTLVTNQIIKMLCFDATEPSNGNSDRRGYGNNRYIYSNLRQWLNSPAAAGQWYTAQHSADQTPDSSHVWNGVNPYSGLAGFLNAFTANERAALLNTTITVGKSSTDGGGTETCTDKIFPLSCTEVGLSGDHVCGSKLAIFSDNSSRIATGLRPACNLSSDLLISDSVDSDGCYTVIYNQAPTAPSSITVPSEVLGGENLSISWAASTDPDGNLSGYVLERKVGSGTWAQIYKGSSRSYTDAITYGWTSVQYRVKAYDAAGAESAYTTSATRTVTNNRPPVISGTDGALGSFSTAAPSYEYTVTDADGHQVDVVEMLDGVTLRSYTVTLGHTNTLTIGSEAWLKVVNGSHTLKIVATDAKDASVTRTLTFTKAVTSVEFEQTLAMEADAMPTKALVNIQGNFPAGCTLQVWICNNGNDASPTWEDITQKVRAGQKHYFTNKTKTAAAWGVKVKAKLLRGSATETCYIQSIGGNFA